jgi:hypothetical protein
VTPCGSIAITVFETRSPDAVSLEHPGDDVDAEHLRHGADRRRERAVDRLGGLDRCSSAQLGHEVRRVLGKHHQLRAALGGLVARFLTATRFCLLVGCPGRTARRRRRASVGAQAWPYATAHTNALGATPRLAGTQKARNPMDSGPSSYCVWLRGQDLNLRPLGYEPSELPNCSTPRHKNQSLAQGSWAFDVAGDPKIDPGDAVPLRAQNAQRRSTSDVSKRRSSASCRLLVGLSGADEVVRRVGGLTVLQSLLRVGEGLLELGRASPPARPAQVGVGRLAGSIRAPRPARPASWEHPRRRRSRRSRHRRWSSSAASSCRLEGDLVTERDEHLLQHRVARLTRRLHVDRLHVEQAATDRQREQVALARPSWNPGRAGSARWRPPGRR